ncbi:hypothetical protein MPDQ_001208 [Monascus purpureus]|uniref:Uncharacterized protein n=1 Tax=Monascus purpureus TaxID=5098 RepID=A0A507R3G5_MONPU|nr:hypothetical protein MPDQ_001208 [Monascus purpureus]BDD61390.1 hypothetical protein MAP00_006435 [Monascus purpureus]
MGEHEADPYAPFIKVPPQDKNIGHSDVPRVSLSRRTRGTLSTGRPMDSRDRVVFILRREEDG